MREMKDSGIEWIGEIPVHWETRKLKYIFADGEDGLKIGPFGSAIRGKTLDMGPYKIYNQAHLIQNDFSLNRHFISEETFSELKGYEVKPGDILFSMMGTIGKCQIMPEGYQQGIMDSHLLKSGLKKDIHPRFLVYAYDKDYSDQVIAQLIYASNGTIMNGLNSTILKSVVIAYPPREEQEKIVHYLDSKCSKIDEIITKQKQIIEKLKEYKLSLITEAVTKGLNPDVEMKESGIKYVESIPCDWENRKMISILSMRVVDGPHESPELFDSGIPYISATSIVDGRIDFSLKRGYISEEYCDICDKRYIPRIGDILVVKLGASTGQVAIVDTNERFNIWVPLAAVRCGDEALPQYVYYAFQSDYFIRQMELSWTYGTQQTLGVQTIERLRILLPPFKEQEQIAIFLDEKCKALDEVLIKKKKLILKLQEYKKSLIYEVVTGKKEV